MNAAVAMDTAASSARTWTLVRVAIVASTAESVSTFTATLRDPCTTALANEVQ